MPAVDNRQSGFTLVELLVAVLILAVGLLGMAQLQVTAINANSQSATITAATAIAQRALEQITAMDPADPMFDAAGTGTFASVDVEGAGSYSVTWTVEPDPSSGSADFNGVTNLRKVTIVVASTTEVKGVLGNKTRTVEVSTLKRAI